MILPLFFILLVVVFIFYKPPPMVCLLLLLVSCKTPELVLVSEQCTIYLKDYDNVDEDICYCRPYIYSPDKIGSLGSGEYKDIEYCRKMIGYTPEYYKELYLYLERLRSFYSKKSKFK